jgi:DNA-damage-inducible protein D
MPATRASTAGWAETPSSSARPSARTKGAGKEVRGAIKRIGGTLPENIKEVEKRLKSATPKLQLDEHEAGGLLGDESKTGPKK